MNLVTKSEFDLIGQEVVISDSKNKEIIGIKGKIAMETKNMFVIKTENGKKNIPKNICQWRHQDGMMETGRTKLNNRPYESLEMLAWPEILGLK